jgi:hypothetical protein
MNAFTALRLIAESNLKPMTEADYYAFAGAGPSAHIGETEYNGNYYTIIVDENGVEFSRFTEDGEIEGYNFSLNAI